jgi:hypothetical protein
MQPPKSNFCKHLENFQNSKINLRKDFYKNKTKFESTALLQYFRRMPKAVLNHVHFPAFNSPHDWLALLKRDEAIKDVEKGIYSVQPKGAKLKEGFRR